MKQMMPGGLTLDIVTMPRPVLSVPIRQLIVRSFEGELAILAGHMPLMALLLPCVVQIFPIPSDVRKGESGVDEIRDSVFISGGVLEVQPQRVIILAEEALFADEINIEHARAALVDAHRRMRENFLMEDRERARIEVMSAQAQIDLWQWNQARVAYQPSLIPT